MDDAQIVTQTLNATLQRHAKQVANYEIEIVNLTAEIVRLQAEVANLVSQVNELKNEPEIT